MLAYRGLVLSSISPTSQWLVHGASCSLRTGKKPSGVRMGRLFRLAFLAMFALVLSAASASATTYYIAANGSDSNNGTAKTTPWQHAPGMTGCTSTCGSTTPNPGDSFIIRGGDTWHTSSGSPIGLPWNWQWSGSSSGCNVKSGSTSTCIYVGVDTTWFAGSSWTRPVFSMDNPLSTGRPSGCQFDDGNITGLNLGSQNYLVFDNFEFTGKCWNGSPNTNSVSVSGNQVQITNFYFHGWTYGSGSSSDSARMIAGGGPASNYILIDHMVCDGSDSSLGTTANQASGFCLGIGTEIAYSVFNHVSNGCICTPSSVHDNLFENMFEPQGSVHGNVIESNGANSSVGNMYLYNNVTHDIGEGVTFWPEPYPGTSLFVFNNVFYNIGNGGNCLMVDGQGSAGSVQVNIYNNTFDYQTNVVGGTNGGCQVNFFASHSGQQFNGSAAFQNNHFINYPSSALTSVYFENGTPISFSVKDNGGELFQSESQANSQGYTTSNRYAPSSSSGSTVSAGQSAAGSCSTFSSDGALCKGTSGGVLEGSNQIATYPAVSLVTRSSSNWDIGAYQFGAGSGSANQPPTPPRNLAAIVQ
jgi:hypothetical protein